MTSAYFWEKKAERPEFGFDKPTFYELEDDPKLRDVINILESKLLGKKVKLNELKPSNPSVIKWIISIFERYPHRCDDTVDDLLNEWRSRLYTKAKEKEKFIVGLLQLEDVIVLAHCKKDPSLVELENRIFVVVRTLDQQNVKRAVIIRKVENDFIVAAYEYSKVLSKGLAEFLGIEPEYISWESVGSVTFFVELESVKLPVPILLDAEISNIDQLIKEGIISPNGEVKIGREFGKITKVKLFRKIVSFQEFYNTYIIQKEHLARYRHIFQQIVPSDSLLADFISHDHYEYIDDIDSLSRITTEGYQKIVKKEHPRYLICFFTKKYPGIKPSQALLSIIESSIFEKKHLELWHAGEDSCEDPITIGKLSVFNLLYIPSDFLEISNELLKVISDMTSRKIKYLLRLAFCSFWLKNLNNIHFTAIFDFLIHDRILPTLKYEFETEGISEAEDVVEFKSASAVDSRDSNFADYIVNEIRTYLNENRKVYSILFGIEDNGKIKPVYHLKSDRVSRIEKLVNKKLSELKIPIRTKLFIIPYKDNAILAVIIVPIIQR